MITTTIMKEESFTYIPRIYFHGTLEEELGYDLLCCDNELLDRLNKFNEEEQETLVRFEKAKVNDKTKQVVMYIWKGNETNYTLGLAVNHDDIESIQYATQKMKARVDCL